MKSIQMKDKMRKKTEKLRRVKLSTRNVSTKPDLSVLRKPIDTSASNFYQVSDLLESGTDEVKSILSYECNILYECRTCRSLFRSIINLISHKREYCKEKFHVAFGKEVWNNCNSHNESVIHLYETEQTINKDDTSTKNDRILRSQSKILQSQSKEASKKDLSTIVDMLSKKRKEENEESSVLNEDDNNSTSNNPHIYLESISTNCSAVYQTVKTSNAADKSVDLMKVQVAELQSIENEKVTLDGQVLENQAEESDSSGHMNASGKKNELSASKVPPNNLSCTICKSKFSTKKTLYVHMKVLHTPHRKCYLCPCCSSTFANTWSVHRHLYKVHRKTNEQVRKLRLEIQEKVLDSETTPGGGLRNTRASKASICKKTTVKNGDISQGSEDRVESNVQSVSGSKRRKRATRKKALPIDYQIAEDDDVISSQSSEISSDSTSSNILSKAEDGNAIIDAIAVSSSKTDVSDTKTEKCTSSSSETDKEMSEIRVQDFYSLDKGDWNTLENNYPFECNSMHNNNDPSTINSIKPMKQDISDKEPLLPVKDGSDNDLQLPLIKDIADMRIDSIQEDESGKLSSQHDEKQLTDMKERNTKDPLVLIEEKVAKIADFQKVRCLLCRRKFMSVPNLRRHVAMHVGWNRYRCNLCEYKCFTKCDCVLHCNKVHNAQNNRKMLEETVVEIPPNEYTCDENAMDKRVDDADVDVSKSADQLEVHADLNSSDEWNACAALENKIIPANEQQESQETVKSPAVDFKTVSVADWTEFMMNDQSEKLSFDDKRMIIEVIFGSTDVSTAKEQTDTNVSSSEINNDPKELANANDDKSSSTSTDSKEASCSILSTLKHQRPMRNRIKPLNDDFIYDLEQIACRKESALSHNSEPLRKKARLNKC